MKILMFTLATVIGCSGSALLAATQEQRSQLNSLTQRTSEAARHYQANRKENAAELLRQIIPDAIDLLREGDSELHRLARPLYQRLQRAGELLHKDGYELPEIPSWDSIRSKEGNKSEAGKSEKEASENQDSQMEDTDDSSSKISFAGHIAPLLSESCKGCHIGGQRASGGLRMDNFTQLMRGGSSGAMVVPGDPEKSLLIGKLTGRASGQRMPAGGRPALSSSQISMISQWITEGAAFDGPSLEMNIESISKIGVQSQATHEELSQQRLQQAWERFAQAFPNETPESLECDDLILIGNVPVDRLQQWQKRFQQAVSASKKFCGVPNNEPLVRGRLSVFVLSGRYDYSEFGRMVERRELPRQWNGHWTADSLLPTIAVFDETASDTPMESLALQLTLGASLGSRPGMQYWFAEGVARNQVAQKHRRTDPRIRSWQQALPEAMQRATDAEAIVEGKLDEESLGLIGMGISEAMTSRTNRVRLQAMMKSLVGGADFSDAMSQSFGEPDVFVSAWLGK